jgi:nitrous oxide reductase accessory protein NosL
MSRQWGQRLTTFPKLVTPRHLSFSNSGKMVKFSGVTQDMIALENPAEHDQQHMHMNQ